MYKAIAILVLLNIVSGCSFISALEPKPWVKPYERDSLADPVMAFDRNGVDGKFMTHGFGNREAAIGAEGSGGGGCGCN